MDWMNFMEGRYEDFMTGKMTKDAWANVAMNALEELMKENHGVLERLKNDEPNGFNFKG